MASAWFARSIPQSQPKEASVITSIHSVTVPVADQDAALDFYVNTLGWEKAMDNPMGENDRWLTVVPPGGQTQVALAHERWWSNQNTPINRETGISLIAPDIDATYETLTSRGVRFKEPVGDMPWGGKATWFYDLDGNEFFLANG
jgi:catechol 2,3-dioxygenase-like lactoylglutathione lyase family enzyme